MKIYVASSWRNQYQQDVVKFLRDAGHEVYDFKNPGEGLEGFSSWPDEYKNCTDWNLKNYIGALSHPRAERAFLTDFTGMDWADVCVLVLPCGKSAHLEAGYMRGEGKSVYVYMPEKSEPELMYSLLSGFSDSPESLL